MLREKSVGAVIFHVGDTEITYLVLQYRHQGWEFARGHVESGESEIETAQREIEEETGLIDLNFIKDFREAKTWFFKNDEGESVKKEAVFFLAKSDARKVTLNEENLAYQWVPFREAHQILAFAPSKIILTQAHHYIHNHKLE